MSVYDLHFNKDDVTIRNIVIGLLATLYDNISWYNQIGTAVHEKREIKVPFYFSTTGTERYLQDNFLNNIDFDPEMLQAETFYNKIPRGIIDLNAVTIESSAIVNKYVRMEHQKQEDDGTLNTYNSEAFMVPIILNVDAIVYVDSILDQMKCTESIIRTFFKAKTYQIDTAYTRIPCLITFPDDYQNERTVEYSFTDKKEFKVSFSLQIKSHIPVFKENSTYFAGNTMQSFQSNVYLPPLIFGSSGGGASNLLANQGQQGPTGSIGPVVEIGNPIILGGTGAGGTGAGGTNGNNNENGTNGLGPTTQILPISGQSFGSVSAIAPTGPTITTGVGGNTLGPSANITAPGPTTYFVSDLAPDTTWPILPSGIYPPNGGSTGSTS